MARRKSPPSPGAEAEREVVLNNPFADLQIEVPEPPAPEPPPPPPPPTREELLTQALSPADQTLLKEFVAKGGGMSGIGRNTAADAVPKGPVVTLVIQKKGHKGRVVTLAHGLKELTFTEQMELCHAVKTALGIGARFVDGVLELQGDQRQRASEWLSKRQFRCRIPS